MGKVTRNSSIELLRIIAMIMIVFHHFAVHGGFKFDNTIITIPYNWYNFIIIGGKIGVDIFVLISGYFLIQKEDLNFNFKRLMKLWGQLFFYSVGILIISLLMKNSISIKGLINSFMPIRSSAWWFAKTYFVLYIIHPFLNKLLQKLNKKEYQSLLVMMVICWSVIPSTLKDDFESNSLVWFVVLYAIAAYERLYGFNRKISAKQYILLGAGFYFITFLISTLFMILGLKWGIFSRFIYSFNGQNKLNILLTSLFLFIGFARLNLKYNRYINVIASTTFGIYLIHDSGFFRSLLWNDIFKNASYQDTALIIPYSIVVVVLVFVVCSLIDLIRQRTFEKLYMKFINKYLDSIIKFISVIIDFFKMIIFG